MTPKEIYRPKATPTHVGLGLVVAVCVGCTGSIGNHASTPGAGAGTGAGSSTGSGGAGASTPGVYVPASPSLRLLTVSQYQNSMRALLGDAITVPADLELDTVLNGFVSIGASKVDLSPLAVEQLESAALAVAKQALSDTANRGTLVGCTPAGTTDDACARSFITAFGRRAWRRPLTAEEVTRYAGIATAASTTLGNFYGGLEYGAGGSAAIAALHLPRRDRRAGSPGREPARPERLRGRDAAVLFLGQHDARRCAAGCRRRGIAGDAGRYPERRAEAARRARGAHRDRRASSASCCTCRS